MRLYVVQMEEGSGIPGTPEIYLTEHEADDAYIDRWREALGIAMDLPLPDDFDESEYWPEDGGVRQWVIDVDGLELEPGPCAECGDLADDHLWHNDISHTYST